LINKLKKTKMKNYLLSVVSIFFFSKAISQTKKEYFLNQKLDSKLKKEIVLVKILNDSRCPEKVQCIWAGEVTFEVAAYEDKKLVEQTKFTLNNQTQEEVKKWFESHLPKRSKTLQSVCVLPGPRVGVETKQSDYFIKLIY